MPTRGFGSRLPTKIFDRPNAPEAFLNAKLPAASPPNPSEGNCYLHSTESSRSLWHLCEPALLKMINSVEAQKCIRETLVGFPPRVISAYHTFAEGGDAANLDIVVLGVLHFYLAKKPAEPLDALPGTTRLVEDLGCDSLTMMDTIFMVETLFKVRIDDAELIQLTTLDELRLHLRRLVKESGPAAA